MSERKRKKISRFIDIEADDGSSDTISPLNDSSEEVNDSSFSKEMTRGESWQTFTSKLEKKYEKEIESEKKRLISQRSESEESELSEKSESEIEEQVDVKPQAQLRPTLKSPKLFLIKVKTGNERSVFFRLRGEIDKKVHTVVDEPAFSLTNSSTVISNKIFSVIYKESLPGFLYLESHSRQAVINVIENIRFIKKRYISAIPVDEMIEVLSFKEQVILKGSWVKVKKGHLKGEIGQVAQQLSPELLKVKFVPIVGNRREFMDVKGYFDRKIGKEMKDDEYKINGQIYDKDGFILRKLRLTELRLNLTATVEELSMFKKSKNIEKGDFIEIKRGELKNVKGKVASISDSHVQIIMKTPSDPSSIQNDHFKVTVSLDNVVKSHSLGDSVRHGNENGIIVHLERSNAIVAFDHFAREEKVPLNKLSKIETSYEIKKPDRRPRQRRDPMLGKKVIITTNQYKGYQGVVKDVIRNQFLVELVSNLKRIEIDRKDAILHSERGASPFKSPYRSPSLFSPGLKKTPVLSGYRTPSALSGYKTPSALSGYKTPSALSGYKTPSGIEGDSRKFDHKTPSSVSKTPAYKTPGEQYDPAYKTPGYKTPGQTAYSGKDDAETYTPINSQYYGALVKINNLEKVVKDIVFHENCADQIILPNGEKYTTDEIKFVMPEQFCQVVVLKGKYKGNIGMLLRLMEHTGIVRSNTLGAIEVELSMMTKLGR